MQTLRLKRQPLIKNKKNIKKKTEKNKNIWKNVKVDLLILYLVDLVSEFLLSVSNMWKTLQKEQLATSTLHLWW